MLGTFLAICGGYIIGQAICRKFLSHQVPNTLSFIITFFMVISFQVAGNFFWREEELMSIDFFLTALMGCGIGHSIVRIIFKE